MKTAVAGSSLEVYHNEIQGTEQLRQRQQILNYLDSHRCWVSRKWIAHVLGWEPGTVAGRVRELIDDEALVESYRKQKCPVTGRTVKFVRIAHESGEQMEFPLQTREQS